MKVRRRYPSRPLVGAGALVHRRDTVLLVKRANPPAQGMWAIPGGLVELGESVQDAATREVEEETGLKVQVEGLLDVQTDIHRDRAGRLEYHYILVDYLAKPIGGTETLNSESSAYGWFTWKQTRRLQSTNGTKVVLDNYFRQHAR